MGLQKSCYKDHFPTINLQGAVAKIFREGTVHYAESVNIHSYDTAFGYHMGPSCIGKFDADAIDL